jgi:hypothetical protein
LGDKDMRFVSPVALGLVLALTGVSTGVIAPATAVAGKPKTPKLTLSPAFLPPIQAASVAIQKKDVEASKAALAAAEPLAQTNDDRYQFFSLLLNYSIIASDAAAQGRAVAGILDNSNVSPEQMSVFAPIAAEYDNEQKNFDGALARVAKARAANANSGDLSVAAAKAWWGKAGSGVLTEPGRTYVSNGLKEFRAGIDAKKAAGKPVSPQWYTVAIAKADAAGLPEISEWAQLAYDANPSGESLRSLIRVYQRVTPNMSNRENLDLVRLMRAGGGLILRLDYIEYAEMAFKGGSFGEVKSGIEAGRVARVLNTADGADYYSIATSKIAADKASLLRAEADANKSANGKIASATADAYLSYGDFAKASALYRLALTKGGVDAAEVNTRLGITLASAGDYAGAKSAFSLVTGGVRGGIAKLWLQWLASKPAV